MAEHCSAVPGELPGCVICVSDPSEPDVEPSSCSGSVLCRGPGLVLCPAAVLVPFLQPAVPAWPRGDALPPSALRPGLRIVVLRAAPPPDAVQQHSAHPLAVLRCDAFARALPGTAEDRSEALPWFCWLRVPGLDAPGGTWTPWAPAAALQKGAALLACGTPFGALCPELFLNALSSGVLSNATGPRRALLLTDARCLPGTQGGPVLALTPASSPPRLVAVIAATAGCQAGQGLGLALLCSLDVLLHGARSVLHELRNLPPPLPLPQAHNSTAMSCTALVESGGSWGSGTLVAPRLLLTCRHVLQMGAPLRVTLRHGTTRDTVLQARLVFATAEASPFDVAVLELQGSVPSFQPPDLATTFQPGEPVLALGFGALGRACAPSVTGGVLSAVVGTPPVMLQSTCAVHAGSSGGPLLSARDGCLLGIVASNTRDNAAGTTYPHLNFCIPVSLLRSPLARYGCSGDPAAFAPLNAASEGARAAWRLQQRPPSTGVLP
ncbi:peroxisomal leader peptide-processing protease [Coturnix japonica]|uniref:Peroxisomal leader peptide-processing protease n=1 Tax=Coturnix japonica TaxID=93934 RepID=A0A8C2TGS5_COTJA|nr:peroxisomal leader peptide-processing protease [Coturnix japonica]